MSSDLYLQPGRVVASADPVSIRTVLGSCVAVCLWDPVARVGGMNHFLLPEAPQGERSCRYARPATEDLLRRVRALGSRGGLVARLFGGACVSEAFRGEGGHLGWRNVETARRQLAQERVPILDEHVGGSRGRRLDFYLSDGSAVVRLL